MIYTHRQNNSKHQIPLYNHAYDYMYFDESYEKLNMDLHNIPSKMNNNFEHFKNQATYKNYYEMDSYFFESSETNSKQYSTSSSPNEISEFKKPVKLSLTKSYNFTPLDSKMINTKKEESSKQKSSYKTKDSKINSLIFTKYDKPKKNVSYSKNFTEEVNTIQKERSHSKKRVEKSYQNLTLKPKMIDITLKLSEKTSLSIRVYPESDISNLSVKICKENNLHPKWVSKIYGKIKDSLEIIRSTEENSLCFYPKSELSSTKRKSSFSQKKRFYI